jgi:hypothetical protein
MVVQFLAFLAGGPSVDAAVELFGAEVSVCTELAML